ncbi:ABC transporter substrate-binding protein [Sporichthya polymorpha]|uniref:ABC transporter substrate-binding protein n=1 Tax=Sporichthya polymorpha TaxID=35751 RepID=UPI00039CD3B5|nr:ABC transporter substrate-binding protein [Sporichthya polymorpha]
MATPRLRKLTTAAVAGVCALALVAGCGGSDVTDAATGTDGSTVQTEPGAVTDPGTTSTETGAEVPAAVATTGTTGGTAPGTTTTDGAAPAGDTTANQPAGNQGGKKPAGGNAAGAAAASGSPVEKLVASHPMFGGNGPCKPATLSEVPLGNVSTLSGVLGELFSPVVNALNVWVASTNACGGLNGHKIKLYFDDDQGDPSTASTKVQNMISSKKILAFVGNIQVLTVDAVAPIIRRTGIPIIGSDVTNSTWFTNPLMFPQGAPQQSIAYGFLYGATKHYKVKNVGLFYCIEVPRSCSDTARAFNDLAPKMGAVVKVSSQVSLTQPSFVQQCLEMKNAGVEAVGLNMDAASMKRIARSCEQVGFFPKAMGHPLGVGNEKQFLGSKWLGNSYVPLNVFGWMASSTPAEKYYQAQVRKFDPGFDTGGAASLGWTAGALMLAASAGLSPDKPTTQQLLDTLWQFKGQKFTELGGLTGPRIFGKDQNPRVPYCLFAAISSEDGNSWKSVTSKPTCTDIVAPSDPQAKG